MATIHGMLAQVLEQTNALWQAQASTNHVLDEFRRSIPGPQENADMDARLRCVEAVAETLAHSQHAHIRLPPMLGQGTGNTSSANQAQSIPQSAPQYLFLQSVSETPGRDSPVNPQAPPGPITPTPEVVHPILHTTDEEVDEVRRSTLVSTHSRGKSNKQLTMLTHRRRQSFHWTPLIS